MNERDTAQKPLRDKCEGACQTGPCRMPRRCWAYETCFLYSSEKR